MNTHVRGGRMLSFPSKKYRNLKKLVGDKALREKLIANGLVYVQEHFQWSDKISDLERIFEAAVNG